MRRMSIKTIVGFLAGAGTTFSFLPQLIRVIRQGSAQGLSPSTFMIHTTGVSCWIAYGILARDWIIVLFNSITCSLTLIIWAYIFFEPFHMDTCHIIQDEEEEGAGAVASPRERAHA